MNFIKNIRSKIGEYYPSEISFLFILLLMVLFLFFFIEISDSVVEGETYSMDKKILMLLRDDADPAKPLGPERLPHVVRDITALGSSVVLTLITIFAAMYLYLRKEKRSVIYVLSASIGGAILVQILKFLFARERPEIVEHLVSEISMSFPSGHSAMSAVIYLSLAVLISRVEKSHILKVYIVSFALIITFVVGISRVYLGVHYPTDVLAGWSIGLFWALFCWFFTSFLEKRSLD